MEAIPELYGADSDDLDESLQEDAQARQLILLVTPDLLPRQAEIIEKICSTGDCEAW